MRILSLHHVTATVAEALPDLEFYSGFLGLRLVKRTVNFDNHFVYHFYYGDGSGAPGTIMTTFPYAGMGVRVGVKGSGQITRTALSVPAGSLEAWRARAVARDLRLVDEGERFGAPFIAVHDPSELEIELVESAVDERKPWPAAGIDPAFAVRGLAGVSLLLADPAASIELLTGPMGFAVEGTEGARTRLRIGDGGPGRSIDLVQDAAAPRAINGLGTVHHVAFAIATGAEQLAAREELIAVGRSATEVRDRQYFTSIYFREPGGVLYEIATTGPGFAVDEPADRLGRALKLPPWEEPHRAAIEARLPPIDSA